MCRYHLPESWPMVGALGCRRITGRVADCDARYFKTHGKEQASRPTRSRGERDLGSGGAQYRDRCAMASFNRSRGWQGNVLLQCECSHRQRRHAPGVQRIRSNGSGHDRSLPDLAIGESRVAVLGELVQFCPPSAMVQLNPIPLTRPAPKFAAFVGCVAGELGVSRHGSETLQRCCTGCDTAPVERVPSGGHLVYSWYSSASRACGASAYSHD